MSVTKASLLGDTFGSSASGTIPVGGIIMWSGSSTPTGWQLCNGTDLPSTSPLRPEIIKTPDLRDRFIVGAGSGYNVGTTGGEASVALTVEQMPSHNHSASTGGAGGHNHTYTKATHPSGSGPEQNQSGFPEDRTNFNDTGTTSSVGDHAHSVSIGSAGGGQAHENRPPYYALAFIMRVS